MAGKRPDPCHDPVLPRWRFRNLFCPDGGFGSVLVCLLFSVRLVRHWSIFSIVRAAGSRRMSRFRWRFCWCSLSSNYFRIFSLFGTLAPQPLSETFIYSARPWSILLDASESSLWYKPRPMTWGYWERTAFPGLSLLLLGATGGVAYPATFRSVVGSRGQADYPPWQPTP